MLRIPHRGHMHRRKHYEESCASRSECSGRDGLLAELFRQRQGRMLSIHHPALGRMGGRSPPFVGEHGMSPMMGGNPRHGIPSPMGMGMGMGMDSEMGMGMGLGMGIGPGRGMGMGPGRPPPGHSPFGHQRHSSFGFGFPGPPQAHSIPSRHAHGYSPFSRLRRSPFSHPQVFDDDDDMESDYGMPRRRGLRRHMTGGHRYASLHPSRRCFRSGLFNDSDEESDDYEDWDEDFDDDGEFDGYYSRHSHYRRNRGY